jgi:hypothetical protein
MDVGAAIDAYRQTRPTVTWFDQLAYQKVAPGDEVVFTIDPASPVIDFGQPAGLSGVKAFELPRVENEYTLILRSYLFSNGYPSKEMAFFYPAITLLDERKQPIRTTDGRDATYILSSLRDEPNAMHRLQIAIPVRPTDTIPYAVIHTYGDQIGRRQQFPGKSAGLTVPLGGGFVSVPGGSNLYPVVGAPVAPPGSLKLRIALAGG